MHFPSPPKACKLDGWGNRRSALVSVEENTLKKDSKCALSSCCGAESCLALDGSFECYLTRVYYLMRPAQGKPRSTEGVLLIAVAIDILRARGQRYSMELKSDSFMQ